MLQARLAQAGIHDDGDVDKPVDRPQDNLASCRENEVSKGGDSGAVARDKGRAHGTHPSDDLMDEERANDVYGSDAGAVERGRSNHVYSSDGRRRRSSSRSSSGSRRSSSRESRHEEVAEAPPIDTNQEFFI
jgi:hypothetical protein